MSGRKFCRICLHQVPDTSRNIYSRDTGIRQIMVNILPGMSTSLTSLMRLCDECFNNVNFSFRVRESFREKKKEFLNSDYGNFCNRPYCGVCFRFETPDLLLLQYLTEPIKGVIEIALSEFKILNSTARICGTCWSWMKKIYFFKKQCFKMEEELKYFCSKYNLSTMTDLHLEYFLSEQYFNETKKIYPPKNNDVNTIDYIYNVDTAINKETYQVAEEKFSKLPEESTEQLKKDNNINVENDILEENDIKDIEITYEDELLTSQEVELKCEVMTETIINTNKHETQADTDDVFDETVEREIGFSDQFVVVISDDEDNEFDEPANQLDEDVVCINYDVKDVSNKTQDDIEVDINKSKPKDNPLIYSMFNDKCSKCSKKHYNEPNDTNNNCSQSPTKVTSTSVNVQLSSNHKNITAGNIIVNKVPDNNSRDNRGHSENSQLFSKKIQRYINLTRESDCQIEEKTTNSSHPVLESGERDTCDQDIKYLIFKNSRDSTPLETTYKEVNEDNLKINLSSTFDLFQSRFSNVTGNNTYSCDKNKELPVNNCEELFASENALLQLDEDCFEVVPEQNNIINLSNVDSYVQEIKAECQGVQHVNKLWGCYVCVAKFTDKKTARKHMLLHEDPWNKYGRYHCSKCNFRANWKGSLTRHMALHTKQYTCKTLIYLCPYCSNMFNTRSDLKTHVNEHVISWKNFQCGDCIFSTNTSEKLRLHYWRCHTKSRDPSVSMKVNWELPDYTLGNPIKK